MLSIVHDELVNYPTIKRLFGLNFSVPFGIDMEVGTSFGDGEPVNYNENPTNN